MTSRARSSRATIVPLGDVNDYDDTATGDNYKSRTKKNRSEQKLKRFRGVSGPTVTYSLVWNKHLMNGARYAASLFSVVCLAITFWFFIFWAFGIMPAFPTTLANYALIFFIFLVPVYIIGAAMWVSMAIEFYALSCVLQVVALAVETYLFVSLMYKWVVCVDGSASPDCVNTYYMDTIVSILLFALWISGFIATGAHAVVIFRGSPAQSVSKTYEPQ